MRGDFQFEIFRQSIRSQNRNSLLVALSLRRYLLYSERMEKADGRTGPTDNTTTIYRKLQVVKNNNINNKY